MSEKTCSRVSAASFVTIALVVVLSATVWSGPSPVTTGLHILYEAARNVTTFSAVAPSESILMNVSSSSTCTLTTLERSRGATDFWPLISMPYPLERASPTSGVRPPVWLLELCGGGSPESLLPAGSEADILQRRLPPFDTLSFCSSPQLCSGAIVVTRLVGCPFAAAAGGGACTSARLNGGAVRPSECGAPPFSGSPSPDAVEDAWELGPDELYVRLEGAEFLALHCLHVGACRYICPFAVTVPGKYRLIVEGLRSDWAAIAESGGFPLLIRDNISGNKLLIALGGSEAESSAASDAARAAVVSEYRCVGGHNCDSAPEQLPICDDPNSPGRWVRMVSVEGLFEPLEPWWLQPIMREYPTAGNFSDSRGLGIRFFTRLNSELVWRPYICRMEPLTPNITASCIMDGLTTRGDSHSRVFFNSIMRYACGFEEVAAKQHWGSLCASAENIANSSTCAALRGACYAWDPRAEEVPVWSSYSSEQHLLGHIMINFGQHWPNEKHGTLDTYEAHIRSYFSGLDSAQPPPQFFLWMETPPLPIITNQYIHDIADWRTEPRLRLYNAAADRALKSYVANGKVTMLRSFEMLLPLADISPDSAHFDIPAVMYALTQSFVAAACGVRHPVSGGPRSNVDPRRNA